MRRMSAYRRWVWEHGGWDTIRFRVWEWVGVAALVTVVFCVALAVLAGVAGYGR